METSGRDLSQIGVLCGGSEAGATATAYELINDQQQTGPLTGTYLIETLTSWRSAAAARRFITVDRQAVDQSGSCSVTDSGAADEYTGDYAGSPPQDCIGAGQFFATHVHTTSPSEPFPYDGFLVEAQCGTMTITVKVENNLPEAVTQQSTEGYLSSAISKLDSFTR